MLRALVLTLLIFAPLASFAVLMARETTTATSSGPKPFGIDRRVPWTTSRVVGSPNPLLPFRVKQTFTKLKVINPIGIAHEPGSDRLLLIQQAKAWTGVGSILRIKDDPNVDQAEDFLSIDGIAYGVAFHPDYAKNGFLYVGYNGPIKGNKKFTRVTRYTVDHQPPFKIDPKSEKLIIEWESNGHNGGDLAFGNDGMLYVSSGDGTSDSDTNLTGQDLTKLLAKVLRIDVDHPDADKAYSVPPDNPFVKTEGVRPETWAYGFRNPWRLHIDRKTGELWVGNNGQDLWEQAYLVQRGANYGWSVMEGGHPFYPNRKAGPTPISKPIAEHHHSEMRSLTGGVVYHGEQYPELRGAYLYGDYSTGKIFGIRHEAGRVTWHQELVTSTMQITGFGTDSKGELLIADHGGGYYQLERTPKEQNPAKFPTRLSETGLFKSVKDHQTDPSLIPYSVNSPLWSDGADKERFIALPGTTQIDFSTNRGWNCPEGTVLVKTFSLACDAKDPLARRRIETRLLTKQVGQWVGYSYIWNNDQTDAELVPAAGLDRVYNVCDPAKPNEARKQTWHYPSRTECMVCHSRAANFVLGLTEMQMNKVHQYGPVADNQLRTLEHIGVLRTKASEHAGRLRKQSDFAVKLLQPLVPTRQLRERLRNGVREFVKEREAEWKSETQYAPLLPKSPEEYRHLVDPYDSHADLNDRARSYLHANCSICHVSAGGGNAAIELEFNVSKDKMMLFDVKPLHDSFGIADAKLIAPGDPERSILYQRLIRRGPGQMPPLASSEVDRDAVQMLKEWIMGLKKE